MNISFNGNTLVIGERKIDFEVSVWDVRRYGDLIFVLLDYDEYKKGDPNAERNIVAVGLDGHIRWRIEMAPQVRVVLGKRLDNSYVGIDPETGKKDRLLEAYDTTGSCWKVDPETGKVSDPIFTR